MAHPFAKIFERALKKSSPEENFITVEAEKILEKGYSPAEIYAVLKKLQGSLIADEDAAMVEEAIEELNEYFEDVRTS
jgi:DNA-binding ferritin-like protein